MQLQCEYDILVAYYESLVNVPYIRQPNMMNLRMFRIAPMYPDTDRIICQPISSDYLPFHDKQHNVFVVPSINTKIQLNHC